MFSFMVLAATAAGFGLKHKSNKKQSKYEQQGTQIDKEQLMFQMEQEALQSSEQTVQNLEQTREIMASQRALFASRGQLPGVGTANTVAQKSINALNADERARALSMGFRKTMYNSQMKLLDINAKAAKSQRNMNLLEAGFNMLDTNSMFGSLLNPRKKGLNESKSGGK